MAYGSWTTSKWAQVWSNGDYKVEVQWRYQQDVANNKTRYAVQQLRVTSLDKAHYFYNASATAGIAVITGTRETSKVSANVKANSSQTFNLADDAREVSHNANGVVGQACYVHGYFKAGINANNTPEFGWATKEITSSIPDIDRSGGTTTVSLKSATKTSASFTYKSNVATTLIQYNIDGAGWKDAGVDLPETGGGTTTITISGLSPGKAYSVQFRHRRDYTMTYSTAKTVNFSTSNPSAPSVLSFQADEIGEDYVVFSFDGEYADDYPSQYQANGSFKIEMYEGSSWVQKVSVPYNTKTATISGLLDNTEYQFRIKLVDYYNTSSDYISTTIKTEPSGKIAYIKVDGEVHKGLAYLYVGGSIHKMVKLYRKENGELVRR